MMMVKERIPDPCCGFQLEKLFATILQFPIIRDHSPERLSEPQLHPGALPSMPCVTLCYVMLHRAKLCYIVFVFDLRFTVLQCAALMLIEVDTLGSMLRKTTCPQLTDCGSTILPAT